MRSLPKDKLDNLSIRDKQLPIWPAANGAQEIVEVHEHMNECVRQQGDVLK